MAIRFFREWEEYGFLSNFSLHGITLDGELWPTVEHFYQAAKFKGQRVLVSTIKGAKSPGEAKRIARRQGAFVRRDWPAVRDAVMLEALRAKFSQHPALRDKLLGTGDEELIEHSQGDYYWGEGADGSGKNMLGKLLMRVRSELREGQRT